MKVLMPQLGETVTDGTIVAWHKQIGDAVEKGEVLLDIETDKISTEIEAPVSGVLVSIDVTEGETVDVGTVLAELAEAAEDSVAVIDENVEVAEEIKSSAPSANAVSDAPEAIARLGRSKNLSPAVRRLMTEHNLKINDISGSGRDGRITRKNVLDHIAGLDSSASPTQDRQDEHIKRIPFNRMRKVTAAHMVKSKAMSPHVLQTIDADFSAIDRSRLSRKAEWRASTGYSLSYLPYIARALCKAIADFPHVNSTVGDEELIVHSRINLAIAIDLNFDGLVAAVTRDANDLSVSELAARFNDLVTRARAGELQPDDLQGGTYTLSNPGPFGTLFTAPIINQPQVAILSMDAVKKRPHVIESDSGDAVAIRPVGLLAHSFDHRAIDGAYSAAFLQRLQSIIQKTDWGSEF